MNSKDFLRKNITVARNNPYQSDFIQTSLPVVKVLQQMENANLLYPSQIKANASTDADDKYRYAKQKMPYALFAGVFPQGDLHDSSMIETSNLITIDIDHIEEQSLSLDALREEIFSYDYVVGVYKSQSGNGIWALVAVEDISNIKEYYATLSRAWRCALNVEVDPACKNIARRRFLSYNPDWKKWTKKPNEVITPWCRIRKEISTPKQNIPDVIVAHSFSPDNSFVVAAVKSALDVISGTLETYYDWELLAERLKNFDYDFWTDFKECCSKSPRTRRVNTWKKDLEGLKKVFSKTKSDSTESLYFYKVLKDNYGKQWITVVKQSGLRNTEDKIQME